MKRLALYLSGPIVVAILAPLAFGLESLGLYPAILVGTIPVVLLLSLVVAMPLFVIVARKFRVRASIFIGLAFFAGFISFLVFAYLSAPTTSSVGDTIYVQNGQFTFAGWKQALLQSTAVGLASVPGGLLWWLAARTPLERSPHGA